MKTEQLMFIDIETVPMYEHYHELPRSLQQAWDKKSVLIDKEELDTSVSFARRAGIYAEFGKIICIALGYEKETPDGLQFYVETLKGDDEKRLLNDFVERCALFFTHAQCLFCGHNIREFDIPFLCRRMLIQGIPLPAIVRDLSSKKPWENPMIDTLQSWKFGEYKQFTSLELLATVLGISSPKDDMDGSDVARVYWKEKNLDRIVRYCAKDVITTAQVYRKLKGLTLLSTDSIFIEGTNILL